MARVINITEEHMRIALSDFVNYLKSASLQDGKIAFSKSIGSIDRKAELHFTETAWVKMQALIKEFDKEVAWHGTAYRGEDETVDSYHIKDIFVYPQEVTGGTVNTDQEKYQTWLYSLEDEDFNHLRMQGHSHVNMATNPSSVDIAHQSSILEQIESDMFYIFLIWNKRNERCIKIYDRKKNILFESSDVSVIVDRQENSLLDFMENAKSVVTTKTYTYTQYAKPAQAKQEDKKPTENPPASTKPKKKGHRKPAGGTGKYMSNACSTDQLSIYHSGYYDEYDDFTDPYSAFGYE